MVLRVGPTPTRFPTNIIYTPAKKTAFCYPSLADICARHTLQFSQQSHSCALVGMT